MITCVLVGFGYYVGGEIGGTEVEDFALAAEVVKAEHYFGDAGREVPPMHVEDVDVVCLEFLKGVADREVQGFAAVAAEVARDVLVEPFVGLVVGGVLRCEHDLVTVPAGGHPFAEPLL